MMFAILVDGLLTIGCVDESGTLAKRIDHILKLLPG